MFFFLQDKMCAPGLSMLLGGLPVAYPESFWEDRYIHGTHKDATMVGAEG